MALMSGSRQLAKIILLAADKGIMYFVARTGLKRQGKRWFRGPIQKSVKATRGSPNSLLFGVTWVSTNGNWRNAARCKLQCLSAWAGPASHIRDNKNRLPEEGADWNSRDKLRSNWKPSLSQKEAAACKVWKRQHPTAPCGAPNPSSVRATPARGGGDPMGRILLWRPWGEAGDGDRALTGQPAPHGPLMSPSCCPREAGKGARLGAGGSLQRPPAGREAAAWGRPEHGLWVFFSPSSCLLITDPAALAEAVWGNLPFPACWGRQHHPRHLSSPAGG